MLSRLLTAAALVFAFTAPAHAQLSKDAKILAPFKPVVARASESTVRIKCDDKFTILGTVVDADGFVLTKLSELKGALHVQLPDGSKYEATTVAAHKDTDLALLRIDAKGLKAVSFADSRKLPAGHWVAASGPTSDPVSVGIVSVMTRKTTGRDTVITNPLRGYMGVIPIDEMDKDGNAVGARLSGIAPGGPASSAGLAAGDIIFEVNGNKVTSQSVLREILDGMKKGDVVTVKARRKGETRDFKITLGQVPEDRSDMQNGMGSILSARRTGFSEVLQTDMVVDAKDCGGPVVDLDGNVLGINIARAGRVETWVLPSEVIRPLLPDFKAGKFAPVVKPPAPALPVAPPPRAKTTK